ncbi:hypothetical protein [Fusobacterium mortiferum]|uniref:hypothetical protein n=1 Tax=Fusobacterium mortiferum TaxID=850 RepID=UPI000E43F794|nr:hypothetical protein [Fusobacterium mortiferum]RGN00778.1 hypothetical protein DXB84_02550 [Fusobacterium mortiferum]
MKYTINGYSQEKLIEYDIDLSSSLILRVIADMYTSNSKKLEYKMLDDDKYMWCTYGYLLEQIPILGTERTLIRKIDSLIEKNILKKKILSQRNGKLGRYLYISLGEIYDSLIEYTSNDKKSSEQMTNCLEVDDKISFDPMTNCHDKDSSIIDSSINITTTKLDNLNKIDQDSKDSSISNSSSPVENSSSKEKDTIYQIKSALQSHGISIDTCKNIMELVRNGRVDLDRIKSVLITAQQKAWGEGAIYKALRDNWEAGTSETKTIPEKELRKKLAGKANMLLDDYEKGRIEYDTMIENYIEFCSNPIFTEALKIEYYDKIKKAAEKTLVKTA